MFNTAHSAGKSNINQAFAAVGVHGETWESEISPGAPLAGMGRLMVAEAISIDRAVSANIVNKRLANRKTSGLDEFGAGGVVIKADDFDGGRVARGRGKSGKRRSSGEDQDGGGKSHFGHSWRRERVSSVGRKKGLIE